MVCNFNCGLDPYGTALDDNLNMIPIYNLEELVERLKIYIDLERAKANRKVSKE